MYRKNLTRRTFAGVAASMIAAPALLKGTRAIADSSLFNGMVEAIDVFTDNISMVPAGSSDGLTDVAPAGGTQVAKETISAQSNLMKSKFPLHEKSAQSTREIFVNNDCYIFSRFTNSRKNLCLPMGIVSDQNLSRGYAGAMTLIEGPNLTGLAALTVLLRDRGYSPAQIQSLVWPVKVSKSGPARERANITFQGVGVSNGVYLDRDVLRAKEAICLIQYEHHFGKPTGRGAMGLVVSGKPEFEAGFSYDVKMIS